MANELIQPSGYSDFLREVKAQIRERQYLAGQTNFDAALPDSIKAQALLAVKDHYIFDFLGLASEHSERELEQSLVRQIAASARLELAIRENWVRPGYGR